MLIISKIAEHGNSVLRTRRHTKTNVNAMSAASEISEGNFRSRSDLKYFTPFKYFTKSCKYDRVQI